MRFRNPAWWCLIVWLALVAIATPLDFVPLPGVAVSWLASLLLWSVPVAVFNAAILTWRWRAGIRRYTLDRFMRNYLWVVVNGGFACLITGFATSPAHPSNSPLTMIGVLGMFVLVLGYFAVCVVQLVFVDTRERWAEEDERFGSGR